MSLHALPYDAWASIGHHLGLESLQNASTTCSHIHERIWNNQVLWSLQANERWKRCSNWGTVTDWPSLYKEGHLAACRLSTTEPWCASLPHCPRAESPTTAHLIIKHSDSGYRPPPSSVSPIKSTSSRPSGPQAFLSPPDVLAAALDSQLHFWVLETPQQHVSGETGDRGPPQAVHNSPGGAHHFYSHPHYGHSARIDALLELPTSGGAMGAATGARDHTIKLWAPFQQSSSSVDSGSGLGLLRPIRTLRGHSGRITSLTPVRTASAPSCDTSDCSSGGGGGCFSVLASGSTDSTVKLWDISVLQQLPAPNSTAGGSRQARQVRRVNAEGSAVGQRRGHNALLATLRGHSNAVMSVMRWEEAPRESAAGYGNDGDLGSSHVSNSCSLGLLSTGRDSRLKLWDMAEGRNTCVATWRLPEQGMKILDWLSLRGCVTVMMTSAAMVVDVRTPGSGSAISQGVATLSWPEAHIAAAAGYGTIVAAGGCQGVRAWDVRMTGDPGSSSSSSNGNSRGGCTGSSRELFSSTMPNREPVSSLHMDRVELVGATSTTALHSPASIAVWSMPDGKRVQLLSSTLSAVTIHGRHTLMSRTDLRAAREMAWRLMDSMSPEQADEVLELLSEQHQAQLQHHHGQVQPQQVQQEQVQGAASVDLHQDEQLIAAQHADIQAAAAEEAWDDPSDAVGGSSTSSTSWSGSDKEGEADAGSSDPSDDEAEQGRWGNSDTRSTGRIEPGVLAVTVKGGVIACVDTLGNVLVRDFATGTLDPQQLQQHLPAGEDSSSNPPGSGEGGGGNSSSTGAGDGGDGEGSEGQQQQRASGKEGAPISPTGSKFWRV